MGGQIWMTSATLDGHDFHAICVDADTGKIIYDEKVFHCENPEPLNNGAAMNCYATPSPAIEPGRVYASIFWNLRRHRLFGYGHRQSGSGSATTCLAAIIAALPPRWSSIAICSS